MAIETETRAATKGEMTVSWEAARAFVYEHGVLWERALFAQLFEGGDQRQTLRCLAAHQNDDGGWGHALEHDVRTPASSAVVTEFALGLMREFDLRDPDLVSATASWCVAAQTDQGDFELGDDFHRYPRAQWWQGAHRWPPTAITGRLAALDAAPPELLERTRRWVERNVQPSAETWPPEGLSLDDLRGLDGESWRYRLYHYADYFLNVAEEHLPKLAATPDEWRSEIVAKAMALAESQEDAECALGWASTPAMPHGSMPAHLIERRMEALASGQREDGGWGDAHGLPQWRALSTIWALKALHDAGRALAP
jgi:hypothetical protein